ncbi:50S ribosomal protein L23 [Petrotoga mexicana DSM 14811]|jgi:large subunit ribosomal protein L23|uniref:Large ribosomal subunit protein uL23 n=2 Tax=Petrotoga TaxID=28236 RepID=A0A2K1PDP9_9BACT|nr:MULTISPECIES: 50S ribosomal protein L23 [Petrotoga]MDN5345994.1 large subunit ribosomal protein [Petrotoga sp.]PNS00026.1 50S ribosomal protein L23 [Petrotoga miotherma DSM 10691]PNS00934.1 50S ribosomal protein L23 [Petrotoga mexicana DSM 14811]
MELQKAYDIITRPILTEKTYSLMQERKYTFEVAKDATKPEIKEAIETIFKVKVEKVYVMNMKPKPKRLGRSEGYTRGWKKAIVKLGEGYVIRELQGSL